MEKVNILIADDIDLSNLDIFPVKKFNVVFNPGITNQTILDSSDFYDCLIIRSTRLIDRHFLDKCNMKVIATCSRGYDNINTEYASEKNIKIINSTGANSISAAEHTFGLILAIFKKICLSDKLIREGNFIKTDFERRELNNKKIGIIGVGKVGSYVAKIASAFGMQIIANDIDEDVKKQHKELLFKPVDSLLSECDVVSLHIPMNIENKNFLSEAKLNLMNNKAVFINTSRGGIIDEKHLVKLLKNNKIKFAGLDVFENEPQINPELYNLGNVLLTNHIAGKTSESNVKMAVDIFIQVAQFFA